jgi:hypothetical protein
MVKTTSDDQNPDSTPARNVSAAPNPVWFKPIMFGFMLVGLVWILTYYVSAGLFPIATIGAVNIVIGFGLMFVGFLMTTRWR